MATVTTEQGILHMLKTYYAKEDGLENLLYRNDPLLKKIKKERVGGKTANFSALYSRGGAVSADYTVAKALATQTAQAAEFAVEPGQLFSCCTYNAKELLASKNLRDAYTPIASAKLFATAESFRKTMAVALYGTGHGELFALGEEVSLLTTDTAITMPKHAVMGLDIGSKVEFKASASATTALATAVVSKIAGNVVTVKGSAAATLDEGTVVCLAGCTGAGGVPLLPVGLGGWIPSANPSAGESFFGVDRSIARDRLAGTAITQGSDAHKYESLQRGIMELRRMGSLCDMIVMNDEDRLALNAEVDTKTYFPRTGKGKGEASFGADGIGFSVATNFLDTILDSPYCPKGTAYILDSSTVKLWTYSNADKIADGIVDNEPGKPEVAGDDSVANSPYKLLVDDMFTVTPNVDTWEGPAALIALNFYGNYVVTNPSVNGVVTFN